MTTHHANHLDHLPQGVATPALVVDADVLDRNIARMARAAAEGGCALRPHAKTHKCPEIARRQLDAGAVGLTVATIGEAEVFARSGVAEDLFIAYPLWLDESKAARLRALAGEVAELRVGAESVEGARRLGAALRGAGGPGGNVRVMVEVDSGHHRTGVADPAAARAVAEAAAEAGLEVAGVFTFPGHGYGHDPRARGRAARDEERALGEAAEALREAGFADPVRSGGSTPTAGLWRPGVVDELRPGVYVFNDAGQLGLGSCGPADVALYALATVVSAPGGGRFVLDAGSKVLGADLSPWAPGHGCLPAFPGAVVSALSEHHATVTLAEGQAAPGIGTRVAVLPNHVCNAVNLVDRLVVVQQGKVVDRWPVAARGALN
ncbi:alanine racemase [Phaeacidiphilus oryzae]|uniref:alanine racemase n=1 Tax=Phaeacidiphilus oryzae TaxID=348818 RepID=UPI00069170F5|nr:alanine racemase [Phaeacidiphilus oryzae]